MYAGVHVCQLIHIVNEGTLSPET